MGKIDIGSMESFSFENDPIVIRADFRGIEGGKVLDVDDYAEEFIRAGQLIIREKDKEDPEYKPLGVENGSYKALPEGYEFAGICRATVSKKEPFVGIMTWGEVNDIASPYPISSALKTTLATALPHITFEHD